jgi:fumarylpyruvate hydrolase
LPLTFPLPAPPALAVAGSADRFPVRRIFCVGRNYAAHAREMGGDERDPPFFFCKFPEAAVPGGGGIVYPPATRELHYEGELVIAIGRPGRPTTPETALDLVFGYLPGLDMTRRDLQNAARDQGRPWDTGKNFAQAAPLGTLRRVADVGHLTAGAIVLSVNGSVKQRGDLAEMIWNGAETIMHLARYGALMPGDLIFTGTPAGVGAVVPGDTIELAIAGLEPLRVTILPPEDSAIT